MTMLFHPSRREVLLTTGAFVASSLVPQYASAARARDPRFLTVILRGGVDGLAVVEPVFDPDFERVRTGLILGNNGMPAGLPLTQGFVLNPMLPNLHQLYQSGQALIFHAVATPYRDRSHFDGQDLLENGMPARANVNSGWLNRAVSTLTPNGMAKGGIAIGPTVPLTMRGPVPTLTWSAGGNHPSPDDARARLLNLYRATNPALADAFSRGLKLDTIAQSGQEMNPMLPSVQEGTFTKGMQMIAKLFTDPNGPRIGFIDLDGWDTHAEEQPTGLHLGKVLAEFDAGLGALRKRLGSAWDETVVTIATEFGRTARMNGTEGTDHGTATVAFMLGGKVKGGRVITDWPGLSDAALYENRDLKPTTDLRAMFKGALRDHLGVNDLDLAQKVFPESEAVKPMEGLLS